VSAAQLLLRRLLEQAGGASESGYLLVIDGEGLDNLPEEMPTPKGSYAVHRVSTELGLRHLLWKAKGAPLIAVMPEEVARKIQSAPDILRRAQNQRVHAMSVNDVLEVVLGVRVVGADAPYMQDLALENVNKLGLAMSRLTLPTVIDRRLLTELLVDVSVGEQVRTRTPAELLAAWVKDPPSWSKNISQLVRDALPSMHGDEGRLLAWALAEPDPRLRELVIYGAVLTVETPELPKNAWGPLWKAATEAPIEMDRRILRRVLTRLAEDALGHLRDAGSDLLVEADKLGRGALTVEQHQTSRVLPLAFENRCHSLAKKAADGKPISAGDIAWLASHRAASIHRAELLVLEAMGRLSRYLDQPASSTGDIVEQVRQYQSDGAFADLALLQLRRALAGTAQYHAEAKKLTEACRKRRDDQNRRFADTIAAGYEAALHHNGLTPLHRIWTRTVAPVWQKNPGEQLFVVVLDGCSYPVFLEMLYSLAQDNSFAIGIKPDSEGRVHGMPALAPLPTVTSHARGAIFLGELPHDPLVAETLFRDQDEARTDKARFAQNVSLLNKTHRLFLKADLADGGAALLAALQDTSLQVVAAVFNAVDDQIGSSNTGAVLRLTPEDITAFKPALRAALHAKRRVLVTADHGHSPWFDRKLRVDQGKTPRYLALGKHETAPEGFKEIDLAGLGGPPERRAFAWKMGAYLGNPQVGFHGGCALEEMVVPLAWLENNGFHADEPSWWFGRGVLAEPVVEQRPVPPPLVTPLPSDELPSKKAQLSLFDPAERAAKLALPAELLGKLSHDERAVLVLLQENEWLRPSQRAGRPTEEESRTPQRTHAHASPHTSRRRAHDLLGRNPPQR